MPVPPVGPGLTACQRTHSPYGKPDWLFNIDQRRRALVFADAYSLQRRKDDSLLWGKAFGSRTHMREGVILEVMYKHHSLACWAPISVLGSLRSDGGQFDDSQRADLEHVSRAVLRARRENPFVGAVGRR
ncbi:hypothetical protein SAMD00023353_6300070 [Rosellinia necatrix]|uniref:Uncharacterized protein n=1 Tax=Rosellinia necatrix TaxID=77044 RepID=A0A1S8AAQ9_ROSNE|nr:hypothetical protein SAMD00023353_6300070 [Rosellinia necatrix]